MYGGYGNIWNQASAQWPPSNQNQPQLPVQGNVAPTGYSQPQQTYQNNGVQLGNTTVGGGSTPVGGMNNYANLGMQANTNPYLNFANPTMGVYNPTTAANTWQTNPNLQLQQHVMMASKNLLAFPGGRPPLPPGPPPPDKPKEVKPAAAVPQPRNPPPPPPPPPPAQSAPNPAMLQQNPFLPNLFKPEDALNILKSAAVLGLIPNSGMTPLNVSEELFGSKNKAQGIPGLDVQAEADSKIATDPVPEIVDLENSATSADVKRNLRPEEKEKPVINQAKNGTTEMKKADLSWTTAQEKKPSSKPPNQEIKWELRSEIESKVPPNPSSQLIEQKTSNVSSETKSDFSANKSKLLDSQNKSVIESNIITSLDSNKKEASNSDEKDQTNKPQVATVKIPLEPADGKDLVYDKKTLKQFDVKFREWENEFERWKQANEHHPNKASYKQYLEQWNLWREQLIQQRRSILDTMTKARLDSKDILLSKFDSTSSTGEKGSTEEKSEINPKSVPGSSSAIKPNNERSNMMNLDEDSKWNQSQTENPFAAAMKGFGASSTGSTTNFSFMRNSSNQAQADSRNDKVSRFDDKERSSDRPVERISRNAGSNQNRVDKNPFGEDEYSDETSMQSNPFSETSSLGTRTNTSNLQTQKLSSKTQAEEVDLPFEWSLPSRNKEDNGNPFSAPQNNPFLQPAGPNPFDMPSSQQQKLPSLQDFLKGTSLNFPQNTSAYQANQNPFMQIANTNNNASQFQNSFMHQHTTNVERIARDPQGNQQQQPKANIIITPPATTGTIRLEANPIGMPLLKAAAVPEEEKKKNNEEVDKYSHLFARDHGSALEESNSNNNNEDDDDFDLDAEVVDYGGGGNSMDDMDLPRGEKASINEDAEGDDDFSLDDTEVIDYKDTPVSDELQNYPDHHPPPSDYEHGYAEGYEHGYPHPPPFPMGHFRGRGRGFPFRGRGHFRGPGPFPPPYGPGGMRPPWPAEFGPVPFRRAAPSHYERFPNPAWFQHDVREPPEVPIANETPEVINLSPSPEPEPSAAPGVPRIKIAPRNPEFEEGARRRNESDDRDRSRRRSSRDRDRSRSKSRDRVERVSRRRDDSPPRGRRGRSPDRSRYDRDRSPDSRRRNDDRDRRERDRYFQNDRVRRRSRSRSRTPPRDSGDTPSIVRNPLFPSASSFGSMTSNPTPPRFQTVLVEDILNKPGRSKRPPRIVIIMRGLPGSGKSHIVKLIKEREVENGGKAPRILSLDNYFTTEVEKKEKDPVTGAEVKKTVMEYEFDEEREPLYRAQLVKQFRKTLDEGYFSFVIVDGVNELTRQFEEMATFATQRRFQVYVAEIEESIDVCTKRNIHKRTRDELLKLQRKWERTPSHLIKLDTRALLQDEVCDDVEMEDVSDVETDAVAEKSAPTPAERGKIGPQVVGVEEIEEDDSGDHLLMSNVSSKWDTMEQSQEKLNKLDGLAKKRKSDHDSELEAASSIEMWLTSNMPDDYVQRRQTMPGEKRVRWADIEERREQERMRQMGFVVGHTDWNRMMDPTFGSSALTKTKFI